METRDIARKIEELVRLIVVKDLTLLHEGDKEKAYEVDDLLHAIEEYPDELQLAPDFHNYLDFRFYFEDDSNLQVEFEIWANDEPSDLTLILRLRDIDGNLSYSLRDLRVM
jgi:hypothetical protein